MPERREDRLAALAQTGSCRRGAARGHRGGLGDGAAPASPRRGGPVRGPRARRMTGGVDDADGNGRPGTGPPDHLSDVHRAAETAHEAMARAAAADALRRTEGLLDVLRDAARSIELGVATAVAQPGPAAAASPEAWRPGQGLRPANEREAARGAARVGMLSPADLEALARIHGPKQGARGPGSVLNADMMARALSRASGVTAQVIPPGDTGDVTRHPIGDNLRIAYHMPSELPEIQRRLEGRWSALLDVPIAGHPEMGFEIDRAALERAVGVLDPTLHAALSGLGVGPAQPPRPFEAPSVHVPPGSVHVILEGLPGWGGGHRPGAGLPGRTEFPDDWSDGRILDALADVARGGAVMERTRSGAAVVEGAVQGVLINVVVGSDGAVAAGWPVSGPGVARNPRR